MKIVNIRLGNNKKLFSIDYVNKLYENDYFIVQADSVQEAVEMFDKYKEDNMEKLGDRMPNNGYQYVREVKVLTK